MGKYRYIGFKALNRLAEEFYPTSANPPKALANYIFDQVIRCGVDYKALAKHLRISHVSMRSAVRVLLNEKPIGHFTCNRRISYLMENKHSMFFGKYSLRQVRPLKSDTETYWGIFIGDKLWRNLRMEYIHAYHAMLQMFPEAETGKAMLSRLRATALSNLPRLEHAIRYGEYKSHADNS